MGRKKPGAGGKENIQISSVCFRFVAANREQAPPVTFSGISGM